MKNEDNDNQYLLNYSSKYLILERQGTRFLEKVCVQMTKYLRLRKQWLVQNEPQQFSCTKSSNLKQVQQIMDRVPVAGPHPLLYCAEGRMCLCTLVTLEKYFKEEYFMKCEYYIKFKFQCSPTNFHWDIATHSFTPCPRLLWGYSGRAEKLPQGPQVCKAWTSSYPDCYTGKVRQPLT